MRHESDVDALFAMADLAFAENRIDEGKGLLEDILLLDPHYGRAYNHLGWFYISKVEDAKRAEELFNLAIKYSPDYPGGFINMARLCLQTRRYDNAMALLNQALTIPMADHATIYDLMAGVYEAKRDYVEANRHLKKAMEEANNSAFVNYLKGELKRVKSKMSPFEMLTSVF